MAPTVSSSIGWRASIERDFIVLVDDWHGDGDPLHLVAEIKGYPRGDATGVDNLSTFGHWRSPR